MGLKGVRTRHCVPPSWLDGRPVLPACDTRPRALLGSGRRGGGGFSPRREEQDLRTGLEPLVLLSAMFSCFLTRHLQL